MQALDAALPRPVWPLFLGRKRFAPSLPVRVPDGVIDDDLIGAMEKHGWQKRYRDEKRSDRPLRGVIEAQYGKGESRLDIPLSFLSRDRRFRVRHVRDHPFPIPPILEPIAETSRVSEQTDSEPS